MPLLRRRYELLRNRLDRFARMLAGIERGETRAIHRARVASRRLREVVPLLQLEAPDARRLAKRLRAVTRTLGPVRELDVLGLLLVELQETGRFDPGTVKAVMDELASQRARAFTRMKASDEVAAWRRLHKKLERVAADVRDGQDEDRAWRWAIDARVARRAAALERAIAGAGAVYLPERLHAVRIALKKLRYSVELAAESHAPKHAPALERLKRTQRVLGRMRDLQVLVEWIRRLQGSRAVRDVRRDRALNTLAVSLDQSCRRLHARYLMERAEVVALAGALSAGPSAGAAPPRRERARRAG